MFLDKGFPPKANTLPATDEFNFDIKFLTTKCVHLHSICKEYELSLFSADEVKEIQYIVDTYDDYLPFPIENMFVLPQPISSKIEILDNAYVAPANEGLVSENSSLTQLNHEIIDCSNHIFDSSGQDVPIEIEQPIRTPLPFNGTTNGLEYSLGNQAAPFDQSFLANGQMNNIVTIRSNSFL